MVWDLVALAALVSAPSYTFLVFAQNPLTLWNNTLTLQVLGATHTASLGSWLWHFVQIYTIAGAFCVLAMYIKYEPRVRQLEKEWKEMMELSEYVTVPVSMSTIVKRQVLGERVSLVGGDERTRTTTAHPNIYVNIDNKPQDPRFPREGADHQDPPEKSGRGWWVFGAILSLWQIFELILRLPFYLIPSRQKQTHIEQDDTTVAPELEQETMPARRSTRSNSNRSKE
jgi:hypothetical protein